MERTYRRYDWFTKNMPVIWLIFLAGSLAAIAAIAAVLVYLGPMRAFTYPVMCTVVVYAWLLLVQLRPDLAVRLTWKLNPRKLHPSVEQESEEMLRRVAWLAGNGTPPEGWRSIFEKD